MNTMTASRIRFTPTEVRMLLFHGGHNAVTHPNSGGLFCSTNPEVALSHGPVVSEFELRGDEMLSHYQLNYEIDALDIATIRSTLESELGAGADIDAAWEIVVGSRGCEGAEDNIKMFRAEDRAEAGWEAQRIRGRVAAALGYRAIEMLDEHGTTWLVVS